MRFTNAENACPSGMGFNYIHISVKIVVDNISFYKIAEYFTSEKADGLSKIWQPEHYVKAFRDGKKRLSSQFNRCYLKCNKTQIQHNFK